MSDTYLNKPKSHKVSGLVLIGQGIKVIRHIMEPVDIFTFLHGDMPNEELYAAKRYVHVTVEGPPEYFFQLKMNADNNR